jgi:hypothetical protein
LVAAAAALCLCGWVRHHRKDAEYAEDTQRRLKIPDAFLSRAGAVWHLFLRHREHWFKTVRVTDVEQHAFGHLAHHLSWFEVYNEQGLFTFDLLRIFAFLFYSGEDCPLVIAEVHYKPDELIRRFHVFDALDGTDAHVNLLQHIERNGRLY